MFPEEGVYEFESDTDAREVLVRIRAAGLVRIEHRERGWRAFFFVGQVMISDDDVEIVFARPVEWFVRADAAVDADDEFISVSDCFLECRLLDAVTFREAVWNVEACIRAEKLERAQQHGGAGCSIDVVIAVDQDRLARLGWALQASDALFHAEHVIRLV